MTYNSPFIYYLLMVTAWVFDIALYYTELIICLLCFCVCVFIIVPNHQQHPSLRLRLRLLLSLRMSYLACTYTHTSSPFLLTTQYFSVFCLMFPLFSNLSFPISLFQFQFLLMFRIFSNRRALNVPSSPSYFCVFRFFSALFDSVSSHRYPLPSALSCCFSVAYTVLWRAVSVFSTYLLTTYTHTHTLSPLLWCVFILSSSKTLVFQ